MTLEDAEITSLPTSTIEHRQLVKLFCPSESVFNFIEVIEANFVENLTVKMMIAYDDGSLIEVICSSLKENNNIYNQFTCLFDDINDYPVKLWTIFLISYPQHGDKSKSADDFSTRGRVIAQSQISKEKAALSSAILKEWTKSTSNSPSTSTATINQNNNIAPSEDSYISTSIEDDNFSTSSKYDSLNSHADESSLRDSNIELENYFYKNVNLE